MKRSTVTLAAGLILTAAAVKLAFPVKNDQPVFRTKALETNSMNTSVSETAMPVVVTINAGELLGEAETKEPEKAELPPAVRGTRKSRSPSPRCMHASKSR